MKYGKLTTLELDHISKDSHKFYNCLCECGNTKVIEETNLKTGHTKSCGCLSFRYSKRIDVPKLNRKWSRLIYEKEETKGLR